MENVSLETISETCVPTSNQNGEADEAVASGEKTDGNAEKPISGDEVLLPENYRDSVLSEEPGATLQHTDPVLSTREDSVADANSNGSSIKKVRKRGKRKKKSSCVEKNTNEEQVHQPENTLSNNIIQQGSHKDAQDSWEKPGTAQLCTSANLSTVEDSQPDTTIMTSSQKRRDRNTLKESGVDIHSANVEVTEKNNTIYEVEGLKSTTIEAKTVASVVINSCVKAKDNTVEQQEGTSVKINETLSQTQSPKAKKRKKRKTNTMEICDPLGNTLATSIQSRPVECMDYNDDNAGRELMNNLASKMDNSAIGEESGFQNLENSKQKETDKNTEVNEGMVGAGLCDVRTKKPEQKKKKTSSAVHKTTDMVGEDTTSKNELSAMTEQSKVQNPGKRKERPEDATIEFNQDALEAEGASDVGRKRKKRRRNENKNSESLANTNTESVQCLLYQTGDLPRCSCEGQSTKKLVVFDLNGILADIVQGDTGEFVPDGKISYRSIFRRPFVDRFLDVCFEKFEVGIWSSRCIGLGFMTHVVMRNHAKNLLFCFDQNICITTNFKTQEDRRKPVFLKDLRSVWNRFGRCLTCGNRRYDTTNTLLVDDSPHKALCNPPHTGIFPSPYQYTDLQDSSLGPCGKLRQYLERLADAENVQKFVEENPFGQTAITETHESWEYYSKVIEAYK